MTSLARHLTEFGAHGMDPIIFLRALRIMFFATAAVLMLKEPMRCGGRNTWFHRALAALFAVSAWYSWEIANARMALVIADPVAFYRTVPQAELLYVELVVTAVAALIAGWLLYDLYEYRQLKKAKCLQDCSHACEAKPMT